MNSSEILDLIEALQSPHCCNAAERKYSDRIIAEPDKAFGIEEDGTLIRLFDPADDDGYSEEQLQSIYGKI